MLRDLFESALRFVSDVDPTQLAALGGAAVVTYTVYRRCSRISFDDIRGPENPSFLHGTLNLAFALLSTNVHTAWIMGRSYRTSTILAGS
jgi:hypothetical protein